RRRVRASSPRPVLRPRLHHPFEVGLGDRLAPVVELGHDEVLTHDTVPPEPARIVLALQVGNASFTKLSTDAPAWRPALIPTAQLRLDNGREHEREFFGRVPWANLDTGDAFNSRSRHRGQRCVVAQLGNARPRDRL